MEGTPIALVDSCIFFSATKRNVVMWLAYEKVFRCKWTRKIEDELATNLQLKKKIPQDRILRTLKNMRESVLDWEVQGVSKEEIKLPDPGDVHVLIAAISCDSQYLVTDNLRDFEGAQAQGYTGQVIDLDDFIIELHDRYDPLKVREVLSEIPLSFRKERMSSNEWKSQLKRIGLIKSASLL